MDKTKQAKRWASDFGRQYTDRNAQTLEQMEQLFRDNFGISRTDMNNRFLSQLPRDISILEIGCNIGNQLLCLQKMGFNRLTGLEVQPYAAELARERCMGIEIIEGTAQDLDVGEPFDLVFTSGVLIHIPPDNLSQVMHNIHRYARKYIWGYEYWAESLQEVPYRDQRQMMWKGDYAAQYLDFFDDLTIIKQEKFEYLTSQNIDAMFLLEKAG